MRPSNTVYFVSPALIAATAASLMFGGVSKSGSPTDRLTMSPPAAFSSVASAVIAIVGDGLTRARRSARNGMMELHPKGDKQNTLLCDCTSVNPRYHAPSPSPGYDPHARPEPYCRTDFPHNRPGMRGEGWGEGAARDLTAGTARCHFPLTRMPRCARLPTSPLWRSEVILARREVAIVNCI